LATILGWGSSQDGYKATAPGPDGASAARAMTQALRRARLAPAAIDYINAHGTGTPLNDPAESKAIRLALGDAADSVPVSSIKGAIGHLMAAAGAMEIAACLLTLCEDVLPGTTNHRERDPACDLNIVGAEPRSGRPGAVLSNSFGFGGQNASIILGRKP
jgi:3-oxoacyl-[acyl-carrier-protein] synthase II